jgi:uncharacterized membrane protein YhiD involved in acid resistance
MTIDKKKFKSLKRKVLKKYPNATTQLNTSGRYYVSDGVGSTIGSDFMIPPQSTIQMAWYWANECVKLEQNLKRTHPDRTGMDFNEKKFDRISRRNRKK